MRKWHISEGLLSIWECRSNPDLSLSRRLLQCGQTGGTSGETNHRCTLTALNITVKKKKKTLPLCWDSAVDLVRMSLSWPSAVWILTIRKTLQLWAKLLARSACGRSSMTECHSSSQHCDVQSASTSRPWPPWKAGITEGKSEWNRPGGWWRPLCNIQSERWYIFSSLVVSLGDGKVRMSAHVTVSKTLLILFLSPLLHHHRWREDRHLRESLWRYQHHYGCT